MSTYIRKFTNCLVCGVSVQRGKWCPKHRSQAVRKRNADYQRHYYKDVIKKKEAR